MPSVSPNSARLAVLGICGLLGVGAFAGCSTTQEKAAVQQARARHILEARARKRAERPKTGRVGPKSAHRPEGGER